jgi:hypothetical protein
MTTRWWWRWIPGRLRTRWKLEETRIEAVSSITGNRLRVQLMAQRPRDEKDKLNAGLLADVLKRFDEIETELRAATLADELTDLISDGDSQEAASAYLCPANEIYDEGHRAIDNLTVWGIPKASVERLRQLVDARLKDAAKKPEDGRSALHSVFIEVDEWAEYMDDYEAKMKTYTHRLFGAVVLLLLAAGVSMHYAPYVPPLLWLGLFLLGSAGSSVSVLAKMPTLQVSDAGERDIYGRRIWSRIAVGATGSLIGCALLAWGLLPIAVQKQTFTDALDACTAYPVPTGTAIKTLIVIGMAMLLGWSERTLTSVEQSVFGHLKAHRE